MTRAVLAAAIALSACAGTAATVATPAPAPGGLPVAVHEVVDGDTIEVTWGGVVTPVRLIGIDTPETAGSGRPAECYGAEATAHLQARLAPGSTVRLAGDVERRDRYDRLLAYVVDDDGTFVNLELVEQGYAVAYPFEPNVVYADAFAAAERRAVERDVGLWRTCGGADTPVDSVSP